ncbi:hypothetical protein [Azospirillum lipoferum]|uniref:Uncharacterized protein n=2 Tax=Azospirillaceae TaxID=2829815 RepID=A0A5A9GGV8_AZOLI|nr:hypothetical protein FZ942_25765 [Azospirillum lipoferum]
MKKPKTPRETALLIKNTPDSKIKRIIVTVDPKDGMVKMSVLNKDATNTIGMPDQLLKGPGSAEFIKRIFENTRAK